MVPLREIAVECRKLVVVLAVFQNDFSLVHELVLERAQREYLRRSWRSLRLLYLTSTLYLTLFSLEKVNGGVSLPRSN